MESLVKVENLSKVFKDQGKGEVQALVNLNFELRAREIFGLLGPNGAGKTTALRIISTLMLPTSGDVFIAQLNLRDNARRAKEYLGFLTAEMNLYDYFTVRELLFFFGQVNGLTHTYIAERISWLVELLDLEKYIDRRVDNFSTGMKQKVSIARALLPDPPIIIFDEPINGLDLMASRVVTNLIRELKNEGKSIIISTHNMNLAENLCDRVGILFEGELRGVGTIEELARSTGQNTLEDIFFKMVGEVSELE